MSPKLLAVAHLKGGTGASSVAIGLAAGLALRGSKGRKAQGTEEPRILLLDLDPVAASTFALVEEPEGWLAEALEGRARLSRSLSPTAVPGLSVGAADLRLSAWDRKPERFPVALSKLFEAIPESVETVLLDLPPSSGSIVRGTLAVLPGGRVLAPVQTRPLDLVGFADLVELLGELHEQNPELRLAGVVPTRTTQTRLSEDVLEALRAEHGAKLLPAIREAVAVARAPLRRRPVQLTNPRSGAAEDFEALTRAVVSKVLRD